jgi:Tfp pilus assembly protein PilE
LIELLTVVLILGILSAIVVFSVGSLSGSAKKNTCQATYETIVTGSEGYKARTPAMTPAATLGDLSSYVKDLPPITDNGDGTFTISPAGGTITYHSSDGSVSNTCT